MNTFCHRLGILAATAFSAFGTPQPAAAEAGLSQTVSVEGVFGINFATLHGFEPVDGSFFSYVTCLGPNSPPQPCVDASTPTDHWSQSGALPSSASAQALTPDYGINRVRTWSRGTQTFDDHPTAAYYSAEANSGWREEITTTSTVPVVITFVVSLHVNWNHGGLWAFQMGRPESYDPDAGFAGMDGHTWSNCSVEAVSGNCTFNYYTGDALTVVPGGDNGGVDFLVSQDFVVYPASPGDPTSFTNSFEAVLGARSHANSAEVLGYSTASLRAVLIPPNAGLTFASGHAYNVQVVPEPATHALWLLGLVGIGLARRRKLSAKACTKRWLQRF